MWAVLRELTYRILLRRVYLWTLTRTRQELVTDLSSVILIVLLLVGGLGNLSVSYYSLRKERDYLMKQNTFVEHRVESIKTALDDYHVAVATQTRSNERLIEDNLSLRKDLDRMIRRNRELIVRNRELERELDASHNKPKEIN